MHAALIGSNGPVCGHAVSLEPGETTIGGAPTNAVCVPDPSVSREHCVIRASGGDFEIQDLDSYNGTFVNGLRIRSHPLADGDEIATGEILLVFRAGGRDGRFVLQSQRRQGVVNGEHHMRVAGGQKIAATSLDPPVTRLCLASRAMPVAARVITDGLMFASRAGIQMSAEQRRAAAQNGHQHLQVQPGEPAAAVGDERRSCIPNDIGQLDGGPLHRGRSGFGLAKELGQWIERVDQVLHVLVGEVDVTRGLLEIVVAE